MEMGGYGCRHRADWITDDLAKKKKDSADIEFLGLDRL